MCYHHSQACTSHGSLWALCFPPPPPLYPDGDSWAAGVALLGAGVHTGLQWLISVAGELDKGTVTLAMLNLHHPLVSRQALLQLLHSHYMRAALPKLLKILGHANILGSYITACDRHVGCWCMCCAVHICSTAAGSVLPAVLCLTLHRSCSHHSTAQTGGCSKLRLCLPLLRFRQLCTEAGRHVQSA